MKRRFALALLLAAGAPLFAAEPTPEQIAFFESKVRPVLTDKCYKCHSVQESKAKGGLTLDTPDGVKKGGENGEVIVPGDPEKSRLIVAVRYGDPDLQMPPKGEKLSADEVAALTEWIKMGAPDPRKAAGAAKLTGLTDKAKSHWAYQPVQNPQVPTALKNPQWCRTPVDHFVLAKLEEHGMFPSALNDDHEGREMLLRRATYDLTGLPPTPREVSDFLIDRSPKAYEKVVDRLLASPHYGERWGRFWLDSARYADTVGRDVNVNREDYRFPYAWTYRDYVIDALNADKPYDKFIVEQLAADKLPDIKKDDPRLAALGFITVGERFNNGNDLIDDRINTVSKAFLAMTVACARCHDHKFDPIPTTDYYAMHGIFSSIDEPQEKPVVRMYDSSDELDYQSQMEKLEKQNRDTAYAEIGVGVTEFHKKADAYLRVAHLNRQKETKERDLEREQIVRTNNLDNDIRQQVDRRVGDANDPVFGPMHMFEDLKPFEFYEKAPKLADDIAAGKYKKVNPMVATAFKTMLVRRMDDVLLVYSRLFLPLDERSKALLDAAAKADTPGAVINSFQPEEMQLFEAPFHIEPASAMTTKHIRDIAQNLPKRTNDPKLGFVFGKMNELDLVHPGAPGRAMIVEDKPQAQNSPVFIRGVAGNNGEVVPRRFLTILSKGKPEPFKEGSGRLELAHCIASRDNPLTARVLVNRVWMHHFGEGFVRTPDDLGNMSEPPSHPELIDWLANYFMDNGWSVKKLHKLIMMSRVYQEGSYTNAAFEKIDPQNRLLWRANIRRLDFEAMRDTMLSLSGQLDLKQVGGKPVNITDEPYSFRRSVYGYIDRGNLPELMLHFDFSDPEMPNSKRGSTIVPQQALFLMNSPMIVDVVRRIVARPDVASARGDMDRILMLYRVVFQRTPKPYELDLGMKFIHDEKIAQAHQDITVADDDLEQARTKSNKQAKTKADKAKPGNDGMRAIQNTGDIVDRKSLNPWETYTQALLFSNEAGYVN